MTHEQLRKVVEFTPGWLNKISSFDSKTALVIAPTGSESLVQMSANTMFIDALAMAAKRHLHETTEYRIEYNSELSRGVLFDGLIRIKTVDKPESEATIELIAEVV